MAAFAAVISLKHTINSLLNSSCTSLVSSTRNFLESAHNETTSLQQVLERSNERSRSRSSHERLDVLEGQIRDCAHKLEDVIEIYELSSHEDGEEDLMRQEISSFGEAVKKMEKDYIDELSGDNDDGVDDGDAAISVLSRNGFGVEMVGLSREFTNIQYSLALRLRPDELWFYAFLGEQGSGRTVTMCKVYKDVVKDISTQIFDCCVWVTVGPKPKLKEVLICIIAQVDNLAAEVDYKLLISQADEKLSKHLYKLLEHQRYMIMLDDVDDVELVKYLKTTLFPDQSNGSIVFLTTTSKEIAQLADFMHVLEFTTSYFEDRMWSIYLKPLAFDEDCMWSAEMEVVGKTIIQNCRCSLISFAKILMFLLQSEKTVEEWNKIAADTQNPIFMVADEISEMDQFTIEIENYNNGDVTETISSVVDFYNENIMMRMLPERFFSRMQIMSFYGMVGIGKSALARKLFKDKFTFSHFDYRVWITLGQNYQTEKILLDILAQIYPHIDVKLGDEKLVRNLCEQLSSKRCFIVLDDICSKEPLLQLRNLFPDIRGTTLVTTRLVKVAKFERDDIALEMGLLDEEDSWSLLCQKVFAGGLIPPELEKAGRKIAEKCDGLPLLILTVADELLKVEISQEYWNNVALGKEKSVFKNAHHKISEALLPSYQSLPQQLKPCFLYIGVIQEKCEIPMSNLSNMWISEGFLEPSSSQIEETFVAQYLFELLDRSLVMDIRSKVSGFQRYKYRLHSVFWHLCNSQAAKNKFFHAMNSYDDCSLENIESQRRLCIRNNVLLGMKHVQNSMASNTSAHSLLCVGPVHQYPVPLNFEFRLLRVMNVVTIRLYMFLIEVVRLVHLRYLGLTCNGKLPPSISNLQKLQYLIVKRYMNIKSSGNPSHLPEEIWDMKELKHLQIVGGCLPNHKCGVGLLKLFALLDVSAQSCREEVLRWIPNLIRLGTLIELTPGDDVSNSDSLCCLNNISVLERLQALKCVVVNPQIRCDVLPPPPPISMFPQSIRKLTLSGLGYPWEYASIIGRLKNLEVLELKNYAFQGPRWVDHGPFEKIESLLVEDTDLVEWEVDWEICPKLVCLCIRHCYKLRELPTSFVTDNLKKMEIVDCSSFTTSWAEQMRENLNNCDVQVHNSWFANTTKNDSELHL